jgi:hypothetical protein
LIGRQGWLFALAASALVGFLAPSVRAEKKEVKLAKQTFAQVSRV